MFRRFSSLLSDFRGRRRGGKAKPYTRLGLSNFDCRLCFSTNLTLSSMTSMTAGLGSCSLFRVFCMARIESTRRAMITWLGTGSASGSVDSLGLKAEAMVETRSFASMGLAVLSAKSTMHTNAAAAHDQTSTGTMSFFFFSNTMCFCVRPDFMNCSMTCSGGRSVSVLWIEQMVRRYSQNVLNALFLFAT